MTTVSTHVLAPALWREALRVLSARTRVQQSVYLRSAVEDVLAKYPPNATSAPWAGAQPAPFASIVMRLDEERLEALKALSARTRVRQSEFLREALYDILLKHNALPASGETR